MSKLNFIFLIVIGVVVVLFVAHFLGIDTGYSGIVDNAQLKKNKNSEFISWITYSPKSQNFIARFPREPSHISEETTGLLDDKPRIYDIYAANGLDGKSYIIQAITFPVGPSPESNRKIRENTLSDILAQSDQNLLQNSKEEKYKGIEDLAYQIDNADNIMQGIIFVWNDTLYVITRIAPKEHAEELEDYNYFINTMTFKGLEESQ